MKSDKPAPVKEPQTSKKPVTEGPRTDRDPADGTDKPSIEASLEKDQHAKSNGNRYAGDESGSGGAESAGPDLDKAQNRMPPDAEV